MADVPSATYYDPNGGYGACGNPLQNTDMIVALSADQYLAGANCGKQLVATCKSLSDSSSSHCNALLSHSTLTIILRRRQVCHRHRGRPLPWLRRQRPRPLEHRVLAARRPWRGQHRRRLALRLSASTSVDPHCDVISGVTALYYRLDEVYAAGHLVYVPTAPPMRGAASLLSPATMYYGLFILGVWLRYYLLGYLSPAVVPFHSSDPDFGPSSTMRVVTTQSNR